MYMPVILISGRRNGKYLEMKETLLIQQATGCGDVVPNPTGIILYMDMAFRAGQDLLKFNYGAIVTTQVVRYSKALIVIHGAISM